MRPAISAAGIVGFVGLYIVAALLLADHVSSLPGLAQPVCWAAAGLLWVLPVRWLMLWGAGKR